MERSHSQTDEEEVQPKLSVEREEADPTPITKKLRRRPEAGEYHDEASEEDEAETNFVTGLPYPALRRLLDYLVTPSLPAGTEEVNKKVPEQCAIRAECLQVESEEKGEDGEAPAEDEEEMDEEGFTKKERIMRDTLQENPYYISPFLARGNSEGGQSGIAALRLTSRGTRAAVDHAIGARGKFANLYTSLERFIRSNLLPEGSELPLFTDSAPTRRKKKDFVLKADLILGALGARVQQSRLIELTNYVWKSWDFSQEKLSTFRQLTAHQVGGKPPLVRLEYFRHEEDYMGHQYGAGARSILALGLPEKPEETAYIQLSYHQCWDERDEGWDMQVYLELYTSSTTWKERLGLSSDKTQIRTEEGEDGTTCAVLCDHDRLRGEVNMLSFFRKTVLSKLADSLGMSDASDSPSKAGRDLLTVLLACLGFVWKADVELLWDVNWHGNEPYDINDKDPQDQFDPTTHSNSRPLAYVNSIRRTGLQRMENFLRDLNNLLDEQLLTARTENKERLKIVMRRVSALIAQLRLSRAVSILRSCRGSAGYWANYHPSEAFSRLTGVEVANEFKVIYARSLLLGVEHEYSGLTDGTVALSFRLSSNHLRELFHDDEPPEGALHLLVVVSDKSGNSYCGSCDNSLIAVRVVGMHHLRNKLFNKLKILAAVPSTEELADEDGEDEDEDDMDEECDDEAEVDAIGRRSSSGRGKGGLGIGGQSRPKAYELPGSVTLKMNCLIGSACAERRVESLLAAAQVGRLLGWSLKPDTTDDPNAAKTDPAIPNQREEEAFGKAVLDFLFLTARSAIWDAYEGAFPATCADFNEAEDRNYQPPNSHEAEDHALSLILSPNYWLGLAEEEVSQLTLRHLSGRYE